MKVEIIKDHTSGLKAGQKKNLSDKIAKKLIEKGLAKEVKATKPKKKTTKEDK